MIKTLVAFERRARHLMIAVTLLAGLLALAFKAGWISEHQDYDRHAWYLVSTHERFVVTSEYPDEAACRREQDSGSTCRPGGALIDEATERAVRGVRNG